MQRLLIVIALCAALVVGVRMAPAVQDAFLMRLAMERNPGLLLTEQSASRFAQVIIDYIAQHVIKGAIGGAAESRIGALEKTLMGAQELRQAEMNAQAAQTATAAFGEAMNTYAPDNVVRACRIMGEEKSANNAALNAHLEKKALAMAEHQATRDVSHATQVAKQQMQIHSSRYCSAADVDAGRCASVSAMPNADISAATVFVAEGTQTFAKDQRDAARDFMRMVTGPVPPENLPTALERSAAGQRYLLEKQSYEAAMSMAQSGYARIIAARTPGTP